MDRFWSKVNKTDTCWLWTASCDGPYGKFKFEGKNRKAHRMSWILTHGFIPNGLQINHKENICPNKHCVNPEHLYAGTAKENTKDMIDNGNHGMSKKTHCPKGHEYSGSNLKLTSKGWRQCRICQNESWNKMYKKKKMTTLAGSHKETDSISLR